MKLLLMTLVLLEPFMEHASEWVPCKTSPSKYIMIKTVVNDKWVLGTYLTVSCNESMKMTNDQLVLVHAISSSPP